MADERGCDTMNKIAFAVVYFSFFLDNVLLTVLVPIIPDWVSGASLALWSHDAAPLARLLNDTVRAASDDDTGQAQATVGLVLGARAGAALLFAAPAAASVTSRGAAATLRLGTALLASSALGFAGCSRITSGAALCGGLSRATQGAGGALAGVAGLALASSSTARLLPATALGVLVGYPFGSASNSLWSGSAPFLLIALAFLASLLVQYKYLDNEEINQSGRSPPPGPHSPDSANSSLPAAGALLLATCVVAALEPTLPLQLLRHLHAPRWQIGLAFIPDSIGYFLATTCASAMWSPLRHNTDVAMRRRLARAATCLAVSAQVLLGVAAIGISFATQLWQVWACQALGGASLGALDGAVLPRLVAPGAKVAQRAALANAAASLAYVLGPALGGLGSWCCGFPRALSTLAAANLLYAPVLRHALNAPGLYPLQDDSEEWSEDTPLAPGQYTKLH